MITRRSDHQRGFTLIEMMTVLAIIAILTAVLASMASPGAGSPRTTSDETVGLIQFARLRAESTRVVHKVRFESTQVISVWESVVSAATPTPVVGFGTPTAYALVQQLTLPANAQLYAASTTVFASGGAAPTLNQNLPFEIEFLPDGSVRNNGATIFISGQAGDTSKAFRIAVFRATGGAIAREGW